MTMSRTITIRRALLSVSDKSGLVEFAEALEERGIQLISTGGTAAALKSAGLAVTDVADVTGFPEMMDGRVKTLHPKVHGGLLAIRGNAEHQKAAQQHGIEPIDLLVVNLYPFEATVAKGADYETCVENIDIGGPAMIRAAAKNHDGVTVIVDPEDYEALLADLDENGGVSETVRRRLAAKAFARTAAYDAAISNWFATELETTAPTYRALGGRLAEELRYGENPHQWAAFYRTPERRPGVATATQHQGKALSYNNLNDTDAAFELVAEFDPKVVGRGCDHQACEPVRRGSGRHPRRSLSARVAMRPGQRFRRHYRAEPPARRGNGRVDLGDLYRSRHCPERDRRRQADFRG